MAMKNPDKIEWEMEVFDAQMYLKQKLGEFKALKS